MFEQISIYLNKPFPSFENSRTKVLMPISFGGFVFLFLYIFQPFSISDSPENAFFHSLSFSLITFAISIINNFSLPLIFTKTFDGDNFRVKHNLYASLWFLFTIGVGNWLFSYYFIDINGIKPSLFQYLFYTLAVGIFPMIIGVYVTEYKMSKKHIAMAILANLDITQQISVVKEEYLDFVSDTKGESLTINSEDIVYIKSDGNYCEFYFYSSSEIKRQILRFTMKMVAKTLSDTSQIIRCHRSYFVNINKVKRVSGTARNLSLHFDNMDIIIPVSRANELIITKAIRNTHIN